MRITVNGRETEFSGDRIHLGNVWWLAHKLECPVWPDIPIRQIGLLNTSGCALRQDGESFLWINLARGASVSVHKGMELYLYPAKLTMEQFVEQL